MNPGGDLKYPSSCNPTTIDSFGDDLLLEIFLRLPSLASLIPAALTCRAWRRAVASSPVFRRRFRELHPSPFLGLFAEPQRGALPYFAPALRRDRDMLAAIRGGDFTLTTLLDPDGCARNADLSWRIHDCHDGFLILVNWHARLIAIVNPLAPQWTDYIEMPIKRNSWPWAPPEPDRPNSLDVHLISSDEEPMSFRLVWLFCKESEVQVVVYSSETGVWFFHPWVKIAQRMAPYNVDKYWLHFGSQSNGMLYWPFKNLEHMLKLDTTTMEFSVLNLPYLEQGYNFVVGETMNGTLCIVETTGWGIHVSGYNGLGRWVHKKSILYGGENYPLAKNDIVDAMTIKDGFVYLATSEMILLLCIKTMKIEKLFPKSFRSNRFHPYIMAWPPALVGNYGIFASNQDVATDELDRFTNHN